MNNPHLWKIKAEAIFTNSQFHTKEECEAFVRDMLMNYQGTEHFTNWAVIEATDCGEVKQLEELEDDEQSRLDSELKE